MPNGLKTAAPIAFQKEAIISVERAHFRFATAKIATFEQILFSIAVKIGGGEAVNRRKLSLDGQRFQLKTTVGLTQKHRRTERKRLQFNRAFELFFRKNVAYFLTDVIFVGQIFLLQKRQRRHQIVPQNDGQRLAAVVSAKDLFGRSVFIKIVEPEANWLIISRLQTRIPAKITQREVQPTVAVEIGGGDARPPAVRFFEAKIRRRVF